jgi:hypothetical protein
MKFYKMARCGLMGVVGLIAGLLLGCATPLSSTQTYMPLLHLAPQALPQPLNLQQQLTFQMRGHTQRFEALLEVDEKNLNLALFSVGQTAARLQWNGQNMQETRASWLPTQVSAAQILSDLQLVFWPIEAINQALPTRWVLEKTGTVRTLKKNAQLVVTVNYKTPTDIELINHLEGYQVRIESVD